MCLVLTHFKLSNESASCSRLCVFAGMLQAFHTFSMAEAVNPMI